MKAGVYLRVSTDRQTVENQRAALVELCAGRGWEPDWREETESGAKKRPVLDQLCADAKRGKVGAVVVWAIDRLGRRKVESAHRLRELAHAGVRVVSYQETWLDQPEGPTRALLVDVFTWVAEGERQRLIERTKAGLATARAAGRIGGRPRVDAAALAAAVAECMEKPPRRQGWGGTDRVAWNSWNMGPGVRAVAKKHGIGEGTLRRAVAAARAKKATQKPG